MTEAKAQRVAPIKLLGPKRSLVAAGWGAVIGLVVAGAATAFFRGTAPVLVINAVFGLIYGPMLSLLAAVRLVVAGFTRADLASSWVRLIGYCGLGGTLGMYLGVMAANAWIRVMRSGDLIIFMFVMIGGVVGVLVPGTMVLTRVARKRLGAR